MYMKRYIVYIILLCCPIGFFSSCIRDALQPCPPLSIRMDVADKNYSNIAEVAAMSLDTIRNEHLPFRAYISTLYYALENCATGEVVVLQRQYCVSGEDTLATCRNIPADLPFGRYVFTVWGNLPDKVSAADNFSPSELTLHPEAIEGVDVYLGSDTIDYDYDAAEFTVHLRRIKGKLLIQAYNLPPEISWSDKTISHISTHVTNTFEYGGTGSVHTEYEWGMEPTVLTDTYLAPTVEGMQSSIVLNLYDCAERLQPVLTPEVVSIKSCRNEICVVRYDYVREKDDFNIFVFVNDAWEQVHGMDLH